MRRGRAAPITAEPSVRRSVGRPRSSSADRAILEAAAELLAEVGVTGLTMSAVVARSGVARATVYRRYPTREALTFAVLSQVKGREPFELSGDVEADIAQGVHAAAAVLAEPSFRRYLPLFVAEAMRGPAVAKPQLERVSPNHGRVAREYAATAAEKGLRTDIDPMLVGDLVLGTMIMRLLSTGSPPDAAAEEQLIAVLRRGLRAEPGDPAF